MKISLVVLAAGKQQGKVLDIKGTQFIVGRDPECQLRPASPMISKRHCAILQRDGKALIRDFDSTNGTFVNDEPVKGERELHNDDALKIGPLLFTVRLEADAPVSRPTPAPATKPAAKAPAAAGKPKPAPKSAAPAPQPVAASAEGQEDEDIAAMLLSLQDESGGGESSPAVREEVPEGSTVMDMPVPPNLAQEPGKEKSKEEKAKAASGNTANAAASILEKYMKRPRG